MEEEATRTVVVAVLVVGEVVLVAPHLLDRDFQLLEIVAEQDQMLIMVTVVAVVALVALVAILVALVVELAEQEPLIQLQELQSHMQVVAVAVPGLLVLEQVVLAVVALVPVMVLLVALEPQTQAVAEAVRVATPPP